MKKLILLGAVVAVAASMSAQNRTAVLKQTSLEAPASVFAQNRTAGLLDTILLTNIDLSADTLTLYSIPEPNPDNAWGACFGHNSYGDLAWAERYDVASDPASIQGMKILGTAVFVTGSVSASSTASATSAVYSIGSDNLPGTQRGGSSSLPYGALNLATPLDFNNFPLPGAVTLNAAKDSFFVSFELQAYTPATILDSLLLISSRDGNRDAADADVFRNAAKWEDGSWHDEATDNFGLYVNYAIFPVIEIEAADTTSTSNTGIIKNGLTFHGAFPNPSASTTNVRFSLANSSAVEVLVYDLSGKVLSSVNEGVMTAGTHSVPVNVSELASGSYLVVVKTNNAILGGRIQVAK